MSVLVDVLKNPLSSLKLPRVLVLDLVLAHVFIGLVGLRVIYLIDDIVNDHGLLFQGVVISLFLLFGLVIINYAILDSFVLIPVPCLLLMSLL